RARSRSGRPDVAHNAFEAGLLGRKIEPTDDGLVPFGAPVLRGDDEGDFELEPIGILGVETLVDPVVALAPERPDSDQFLADGDQLVDRRYRPRNVVHP